MCPVASLAFIGGPMAWAGHGRDMGGTCAWFFRIVRAVFVEAWFLRASSGLIVVENCAMHFIQFMRMVHLEFGRDN